MAAKKNPGGAPTKYRPEYCDMLVTHMAEGLSYESFAAIVGTWHATLYNWESAHPEFLEAKKRAFEQCRLYWERMGQASMLGFVKRKDGSIQKINPNPAIWIYNMKCRFPKEWRDSQEVKIKDQRVDDAKDLIEDLKTVMKLKDELG